MLGSFSGWAIEASFCGCPPDPAGTIGRLVVRTDLGEEVPDPVGACARCRKPRVALVAARANGDRLSLLCLGGPPSAVDAEPR